MTKLEYSLEQEFLETLAVQKEIDQLKLLNEQL